MRIGIISFFVGLYVLAIPSEGSAEIGDWIYKIESGPELSGQKLKGSGLLIRHNGRTYFLTSDHTVYRSNKGIRHEIIKGSTRYLASLVMNDWGRGLALLELDNISSPELPVAAEWTELIAIPGQRGGAQEGWIGYGYPAGSSELQFAFADRPGELTQSDLFFQIPELFHSSEMVAEFGMSGGPVFTLESGRPIGLMSHIALMGGAVANDSMSSQLVIIPFEEIKTVIQSFLSGEKLLWNFVMPSTSSELNEILVTGHLSIADWNTQDSAHRRTIAVRFSSPERYEPTTSIYRDQSGYLAGLAAYIAERTKGGDPGLKDWFGRFHIIGYREKGSFSFYYNGGGLRDFLEVLDAAKYEPVGVFNIGASKTFTERFEEVHTGLTWWLRASSGNEPTGLSLLIRQLAQKFEPFKEDDRRDYRRPSHWTDRYGFIGVRPGDIEEILSSELYREYWTKDYAAESLRETLQKAHAFLKNVTY